ncbi:protein kinase [Vibrio lamellibrachiae]|uniref:serine/threonine protein kinase n=1 Tax=Vibrio lamellibrachiae TaxID=2910253 RepID=UPI003D0973E8
MSEKQITSNGLIDQLVVKAIEKRKLQQKRVAESNKPSLEYVLFSEFEILETLPSKNGKTTVYHLANKAEPEKQVCCKVTNQDVLEYAKDMLINEASRLEISQHPSVAEFIKVGTEFDRPYLMYEWIKGESLADKMARYTGQGFRHDHIAWLVYQLAGALEYMHTRGICHLDIKPSNILVSDSDTVKLIDFGASRYVDEVEEYAEASLKYASPLYLKSGTAKPQDDVYSLALLTGHLFLGAIFGDGWLNQLNRRRRPKSIPKYVWALLKKIIDAPRDHGFTAISFAQELAKIDLRTIDVGGNAPIFKNLINADLVLTHRSAFDRFAIGRFKYLEATLVASVMLLVGNHVYQSSQPEWKSIVKSNVPSEEGIGSVKPAQTAAFLGQAPWAIQTALDDMSNDVVSIAPYREAYQIQQLKLARNYKDNFHVVEKQHELSSALVPSLSEIRKELVSLREFLANDGYLFPTTEHSLTNAMNKLNNVTITAQDVANHTGGINDTLVTAILEGKSEDVDSYIKGMWQSSQANSYFYSQVLPQTLLNQLNSIVDKNAKNHYYTQAISDLKAATQFFGNTPELNAKIRELKVARSEYILFSTVTERAIFDPQKLTFSLNELERNAPKKFGEVSDLLDRMANEAINNSYQKSKPANGAVAIQRAIQNHSKKERS